MISFLLFLGSILVLVGFHEIGHFAAAKAFRVYVIEFALGFGPRLFSVKRGETRYALRLIPVGGFVRMAGMSPDEADESVPEDRLLFNKPPYIRALISAAGPVANLLLALSVSVVVVWSTNLPILQVGEVIADTPAAEVLAPGDRILAIDDQRIYTNSQISKIVQRAEGDTLALEIVRDGVEQRVELTPRYTEDEDRYLIGAYFSSVTFTNEILDVDEASVWQRAGIESNDLILAVDGTSVRSGISLLLALDGVLPAEEVALRIARGADEMELVLPTTGTTSDVLFSSAVFADLGVETQRTGFAAGVVLGAGQFALYVQAMGQLIREMVTGSVAPGEALQGPVGVARTLGEGLRLGPSVFFQLLAFLSLNFGLLNLVPFPGLDGSHVGFALYEWVRGKPIPPERQGIIHAIGLAILFALMILITYKDILNLFR